MKNSGDAVKVWLSIGYAVQMQELPQRTARPEWQIRLPIMMNIWDAELSCLAAMLRDIFGPLPFRPVPLEPTWLTPTVVKLAQTIYDRYAFNRLPVLADALEEAGCTKADILAHCRQPGEHVRGCWVVDLLLGKE